MYEREKAGIGRLPCIKVYRNEVRASKRYTFFMSNSEGILALFLFFVNSRRFWIAFKILIKIVQFLTKVSGFFLSRFVCFL